MIVASSLIYAMCLNYNYSPFTNCWTSQSNNLLILGVLQLTTLLKFDPVQLLDPVELRSITLLLLK